MEHDHSLFLGTLSLLFSGTVLWMLWMLRLNKVLSAVSAQHNTTQHNTTQHKHSINTNTNTNTNRTQQHKIHRTQNTEHKIHRTQNTEHRTQHTHRTENTQKHRTQTHKHTQTQKTKHTDCTLHHGVGFFLCSLRVANCVHQILAPVGSNRWCHLRLPLRYFFLRLMRNGPAALASERPR